MHKQKGHLDWSEMKDLLSSFRFNIESVGGFRKEFRTQLAGQKRRNELMKDDSDCVFRFDLARSIFLERGL